MFPIEEIAARHGVSINVAKAGSSRGLDAEVAARRLIENGPNILSPPKQISPFMKFFHCLTSLFNLLLILAGILNYILLAVDPKGNKVNVSGCFVFFPLFLWRWWGFHSRGRWQSQWSNRKVRLTTHFSSFVLLTDLPWCYFDYCRLSQCCYRVLPGSKVGCRFAVVLELDAPKVLRGP